MDKAAEERKKKIRNLEYSLFSGGKSNNVSDYELLKRDFSISQIPTSSPISNNNRIVKP